MVTVKRVLFWLVIAFVIYAIYNTPGRAANAADQIWDIIKHAFNSLVAFFGSLTRQN